TAVNDAPVAVTDTYSAAQDTALTVTVVHGVLANDTDVDADVLSAALATNPAHGTLLLNPDGSFTYTPGAGFSGLDTFTYRATDGVLKSEPATVGIYVKAAGPPVFAGNDTYSTVPNNTFAVMAPG